MAGTTDVCSNGLALYSRVEYRSAALLSFVFQMAGPGRRGIDAYEDGEMSG